MRCGRAAEGHHPERSVRAIFEVGEPIFEASKIGTAGSPSRALQNWLTQADHNDGCAQDRPPMITPRTARTVGGPRFSSRRTRCRAGRGHGTNRRLTLVEFEATITPPATQAA
jgi:hypothetical protein